MVREIGSEFEWMQGTARGTDITALFRGCDAVLTFSGRGAAAQVIRDIGPRKKAALPAWCCESMIEPFTRADMEVCFYPVGYEDGLTVDYGAVPEDCDILLWMRYFGFSTPEPPQALIDRIHRRGGIVMEDCTHSLLDKAPVRPFSDYAVCSLRKWFPLLSGGIAIKKSDTFRTGALPAPPEEYTALRLEAMRKKKAYIDAGHTGDKQAFLDLYGRANVWLRENWQGLGMDDISAAILAATDIGAVRQTRQRNARVLYEGLRDCPGVKLLFDLCPADAPLFVPVFMENAARTVLRQALIHEAVYCPVHWPRPEGCDSPLYDGELSLICDQRYTEEDMHRIVQVIQQIALKGYR